MDSALAWLEGIGESKVLASGWTLTEFCSAASMKVRTRQATASLASQAIERGRKFIAERIVMLSVEDDDLSAAADLCARSFPPLRAGDALHLALCRRMGASIATLDDGMAEAAAACGVPVDLIGPE